MWRRKFLAFGVATVVAGCREPAQSAGPIAAPTAAPQVNEVAVAAPATSAAGATAIQATKQTAPGVACGSKQCGAGEVCCFTDRYSVSSPAECAKAPANGSPLAACEQLKKDSPALALVNFVAAVCDESSDCAQGSICCVRFTGGTAQEQICATHPAKECTGIEQCVSGSACNTSGTQCVDEECVGSKSKVPCGDETCSGATPICAVAADGKGKSHCTAKFDGEDGKFMTRSCAASRDCPSGAFCVTGVGEARCNYLGPTANASVVCTTQADCDEPRIAKAVRAIIGANAKVQCRAGALGLKICAAP